MLRIWVVYCMKMIPYLSPWWCQITVDEVTVLQLMPSRCILAANDATSDSCVPSYKAKVGKDLPAHVSQYYHGISG